MNNDRRHFLRGILNGTAVVVALPLFNCLLNENGSALASGNPLPVRFGTWFWGLGMQDDIFIPKIKGANFDLPDEIASLKNIQQHINLFTKYRVIRDANPNLCHYTGWVTLRSGIVPKKRNDLPGESIDVTVAKQIGDGTRFRSLHATSTGDRRDSHSYLGQNAKNAPEVSPVEFYNRLFGADFQDPNSPGFTPSPRILMQKSVLSGVMDESKKLNQYLGYEDRQRLEQYFNGLREVENQMATLLEKPDPIAECKVPSKPQAEIPAGLDWRLVNQRHKLMSKLMAMAVACNQTRVFNITYSNAFAATVKEGYEKGHHTATHEELVDPVLGYQPNSSFYTRRAMEAWAELVTEFASIPEGDGTLLDNTIIYAHSDQEWAKIHSLDGIPMFTAGTAGGKIKTGLHIDGKGAPGTQLGLTLMKVLGVKTSEWGSESNRISTVIDDILV